MRYLTPVLAAAAIILNTTPTSADLGDQLHKLLANDGAASDIFGATVAISDTTTIVGARNGDDNGFNSGSAYLFNTNTGQQLFKLLPNDGEAGDWFGWTVAINESIAIVGAHMDNDNGQNSGSAYLFDISDAANPTQFFKLLSTDGAASDGFGWSVAISNNIAIVGSYQDDDNGTSSGSAYLFDTTTGKQIAKLLPIDGETDDWFGWTVAICGSTVIVGANRDSDNGEKSGSAYLFNISEPASPIQIAKLLAEEGSADDEFGFSVAISGTTAIVGAVNNYNNGIDSGSAYLFDITTGKHLFKIIPNNIVANDRFGYSVAISDKSGKEIAIVGANLDDNNAIDSGSAYIFDISNPTNPVQIAKLLSNDGAEDDQFGFSVAINGTTAVVGAYLDDDNGLNSGSAYLFDASAACIWDLNKSGSVGTSDLLELLAQWGTAGSADFDGDGIVGTSDLLVLLANWGPCE